MLKKFIIGCAASAVAAFTLLVPKTDSAALTVDDVAEVARQYGYSEEYIAQGYATYNEDPSAYGEEEFEYAIEKIKESGKQIITTSPQVVQTTAAPSETVVTTTTIAPPITVTGTSGESVTRVSEEDFINMDYDTKMNYLRTFTPEQQQIIIDSLSADEYQSLLRSLPTEKKAEVINTLSAAASKMGMNVTVNELTDDNVSIAMRNKDGELLTVVNAGDTVEDTGYDRRGIYITALGIVLAAVAALIFTAVKNFRETEDKHER